MKKKKELRVLDNAFNNMVTRDMPDSVSNKINEIKEYHSRLMDTWNIPDKNKDWQAWYEKVSFLEKDPNTFDISQEFWNLDWILSELENIESSIDQISTCINDKGKFTYKEYLKKNLRLI